MVAVTHARKTRKTTRKTSPVVEYKDPVPIHSSLRNENRAWEPEKDEVVQNYACSHGTLRWPHAADDI